MQGKLANPEGDTWEWALEGTVLNTTSGKRGGKGRTQQKSFASEAEAEADLEKKAFSKLKEGSHAV